MKVEKPKFSIGVFCIITDKSQNILLVKHNYGKCHWSLPGGALEYGESVEAAAIREAKEETGLDIRVVNVIGIYSKPKKDDLVIVLQGYIIDGQIKTGGQEISACKFFPRDNLPIEEMNHKVVERINDFFNHPNKPILKAQYD